MHPLLGNQIIRHKCQKYNGKVGELYGRNLARIGGRAVTGKGNFSRNMRTINQQIKEAESSLTSGRSWR